MIKYLFKKATLILLLVVAFSFAALGLGKFMVIHEENETPYCIFNEETQRWETPGHPEYTLWMYGGEDPAKGEQICQEIIGEAVNTVIPDMLEGTDKALQATLQSDIYKQAKQIIEDNTKE